MFDAMEGVLWKWTNYWSGKLYFCVRFATRENTVVKFCKGYVLVSFRMADEMVYS
jgi:hypothetical protein